MGFTFTDCAQAHLLTAQLVAAPAASICIAFSTFGPEQLQTVRFIAALAASVAKASIAGPEAQFIAAWLIAPTATTVGAAFAFCTLP